MKHTRKMIAFDELTTCDLTVDAVYQGGKSGNAGDDPLPRLLELANQGGFRRRGTPEKLEMLALTSSFADVDWPDELDRETGVLTYFGDNKRPGHALHDTPKQGNLILQHIFEDAHAGIEGRRRVPPIFVFGNAGTGRDLIFLGLAVPGTSDLRASEDLVAVWKTAGGSRFQNYRARFTVLDVPLISREWIRNIVARNPFSSNAPSSWCAWVKGGRAKALLALRSVEYRTMREQLPGDPLGLGVLKEIHSYFENRPHDFEACAAAITRLLLPNIASLDLTRPSRDDMVLNRVEVVSFLPKQNADAVFQNMVVPLCGVNAGQSRISLDDDIHVLAGPGEQRGVRIRFREFEQWRLIEQDIAVGTQSVQRCSAFLQPFDRELAIADITAANCQHL